jgi:exodeoxyribonuclease VII small subunit
MTTQGRRRAEPRLFTVTPKSEPTTTASTTKAPGKPSGTADEFAGLSYEQARDALIDVVRRLEGGAETLEESLALWERGEALAQHCEQWLAGAQARLSAPQTPPP